jgi:dipeptidase E
MNALAASIKRNVPRNKRGKRYLRAKQTTNDMPIVYPPSFKTLGFFLSTSTHIFLDADLQSKHMGETETSE